MCIGILLIWVLSLSSSILIFNLSSPEKAAEDTYNIENEFLREFKYR